MTQTQTQWTQCGCEKCRSSVIRDVRSERAGIRLEIEIAHQKLKRLEYQIWVTEQPRYLSGQRFRARPFTVLRYRPETGPVFVRDLRLELKPRRLTPPRKIKPKKPEFRHVLSGWIPEMERARR